MSPFLTHILALLALILTLGTAWLGLQIFNFRKSPFLKPFIRELISDYALAFAVIVFSLIGAIGFSEIELKSFKTVPLDQLQITLTDMSKLRGKHWAVAIGLGFCLSLLFFMDQNISAALVNTPANKLKKGAAYHLDLFVVALINIPLSLLGNYDLKVFYFQLFKVCPGFMVLYLTHPYMPRL